MDPDPQRGDIVVGMADHIPGRFATMPTIAQVRPVLLTAPYGAADSMEVLVHLPHGLRSTGLVEVTLDDGTTGLGEAYLAVFAPQVFVEIARIVGPALVGQPADDLAALRDLMTRVTGYWSLTGAASHVVGAVEIALHDALATREGVPLWSRLRGDTGAEPLRLYASGGDSVGPAAMLRELDEVAQLGIGEFKIRARAGDLDKVAFTAEQAAARGIAVAVDMTQNLVAEGNDADAVLAFADGLRRLGAPAPTFLEETLAQLALAEHPRLREASPVPIAGGEIVTTPDDLIARVRAGWYDIVQPDATVIGGVDATLAVAREAQRRGVEPLVHCWGSAVGMLANYHVAFAAGARRAEWPLPAYPLRQELLATPLHVTDGSLHPPTAPGLGVALGDLERRRPFLAEAVYDCVGQVPPPTGPWRLAGGVTR